MAKKPTEEVVKDNGEAAAKAEEVNAAPGRFEICIHVKVDEIASTDPPTTVKAFTVRKNGTTKDRLPASAVELVQALDQQVMKELINKLGK